MLTPHPPDIATKNTKKHLSAFSFIRKGTFAIAFVTILLTIVFVWFGITVKQKVIEAEKQWHDYSNEATLSAQVLNRIQANFGYGGFIHNFKNYVLRKDKKLIPIIEKSLSETRLAIKDYPLDGLFKDLDDEIYLRSLSNVVEQYSANLEIAKQLIEEGASSNEIDKQVKVNDLPALQAIEHLSNHAIEHKDEYEFKTNLYLNNALSFINWGLLIIPMVLMSGALMYRLFRKIKKINNRLRESHQFLRDLFEASPDATLIVDESGNIAEANEEAYKLFGFSDEDLTDKSVESLIPHRFRKQHIKSREMSFNVTEDRMLNNNLELYALGKDNKEIPVDISLSYTTRDNHKNAIVTLRDITEKKQAEENIKYLAQYDQLTNLPNRALFNDRLKHAIDRALRNKNKIGLMFIDLDGFKKINDSLGHQAGDELLQIVAERLANIVRSDDTVARFGGDEFIIILEDLKHSDFVTNVAKKVLHAVADAIYLSGHEVTVGASIGISIYPDNGDDAINLIKKADAAMYEAKKLGKNTYKFSIDDPL